MNYELGNMKYKSFKNSSCALHFIFRTSNFIDHSSHCIFNTIGVERFRILGGPHSQQAHDVVLTSMGRNDVASTSVRCHVPTRFLIYQCQIITFLNLKI